jgi:hypothetical protein
MSENIKQFTKKISPLMLAAWMVFVGYLAYLHVQHTLMKSFASSSSQSVVGDLFIEPTGYTNPVDAIGSTSTDQQPDTGCGCPSCCALNI